jgi:hypothetical protein
MKLYQKLFLSFINSKGEFYSEVKNSYEYYVLGALLLELLESGQIDINDSRIEVKDGSKQADEITSSVLNQLKNMKGERAAYQVYRIVNGDIDKRGFNDLVVKALVNEDVLKVEKKKFLGLNRGERYLFKDKKGEEFLSEVVKSELLNLLIDPAEPKKEVILLGIILKQMDTLYTMFDKVSAKKLSSTINHYSDQLRQQTDLLQEVYFAGILY